MHFHPELPLPEPLAHGTLRIVPLGGVVGDGGSVVRAGAPAGAVAAVSAGGATGRLLALRFE